MNSPDWTKATVITDGGSVYSKPDFDAPVSDYLTFKTGLWVTKKAVPGQGGLGLFHKVRYKNKVGFMADTDIKISDKSVANADAAKVGSIKKGKKKPIKSKALSDDEQEAKDDEKEPPFFHRYVGAAVALVDYTEKFSGNKLSDQMTMYGLRMSGPGALFGGPPLDFNLWFSLQKPSYYQKFAAASPTGFLVFGDLQFTLPFYQWKQTMINYGLGIMYVYTDYKVKVNNGVTGASSQFDSQEFRIGADFDLGATYRIQTYAIKFDVKYYYEKTQYFGAVVSFQTEY